MGRTPVELRHWRFETVIGQSRSFKIGRSSVSRGGKDAMYQPPIDQHRRKIGAETRKDKQLNKEARKVTQLKGHQQEDFKDSVMVLVALMLLFAVVYLILFFAVKN